MSVQSGRRERMFGGVIVHPPPPMSFVLMCAELNATTNTLHSTYIYFIIISRKTVAVVVIPSQR